MDLHAKAAETAALLIFAPWMIAGIGILAWMLGGIAKNGGKVPVEKFGAFDLLLTGLLMDYLFYVVTREFGSAPKPDNSTLADNAAMFLTVIAFLGSFLHFRGISLPLQFGLRRVGPAGIIGFAVLILFAAYPLIVCASAVTTYVLGAQADQQELVKYFLEASQKSDYRTLVLTVVIGVFVAPVAEEFIFRGYFYGVLKRYFGMAAGVLLNAALFAAIHLDKTSLPSLFLLAICLTLAYEFTGSILVNMCMHSLFNLASFCMLFYVAHQALPS